ncbi:putative membrane protein [Leptospira interrogans str. UI 13372]|nr:putative membrane protein [Leptospira interrogans str. UI 13372]
MILILIPLFLYIKLTEEYDKYDEGRSIILGFVLSLIFIFYIELTSRFKKVRLFYFFILACSCATLISFINFISYFGFIISFIKNSEPILSFMLTSLIVIIVLLLYFKSPLKKGETEKHFSFLYHWFDLLILIFIPLLLYIKLLAEKYNKDDEGGSIILGFILSLIFIFYIELTSRFEKVRLFYFFILACSCATLISFLYIPLKLIIFYRIDYAF